MFERNRSARMKNDEVEGANYAAKTCSHLPQLLRIHNKLLDVLYNCMIDIKSKDLIKKIIRFTRYLVHPKSNKS